MKETIAYLGMGMWGFSLANLLANNGHRVVGWARNPSLIEQLSVQRRHPAAPHVTIPSTLSFTSNMEEALDGATMIVEGVTSAGIRPVLSQLKSITDLQVPLVITSKGIEQNTGLLLSEIALEIFGKASAQYLGYLSGPSIASEVLRGCPCFCSSGHCARSRNQ